MVSAVLLVAAAGVVYTAVSVANGLRSNIEKARKTGLPYIVIPCASSNVVWRVTHPFWIVVIKLLPKQLWENWLFYMRPDWAYIDGQEPWERLGDTFLAVSPGLISFNTQSPNAIHQITSRREHFPKATMHYTILELFGRNILTTEGAVWRFHRKATSASFNEKNAAHTFAEAIHQTQGLLAKWVATAESDAPTITTLAKDTMSLALHIIGYVGFGIRFSWPGEPLPLDVDPRMRKYGSHTPPPGHTMTFATSVEVVLHNILLLLLMPRWLMRALSRFMEAPRAAIEAHQNYSQYMAEFLADKAAAAKEGTHSDGMDLMGQLVRGRYENERAANKLAEHSLTDDEIIGNAFIMLVAGHETTANALHFTFIELANNPASQRALQADIDRMLGRDTDPAMWNYESSINLMLASMLGAAMNETLRLIPPVVMIPKYVTPQADQLLALADTGRAHVLPAGTDIALQVVAAHRNAKHWPPAKGEAVNGHAADMDTFLPERWYRTNGAPSDTDADAEVDGADTEDYGGFKGPDTSAHMFRPVRGSFTPFSDGPRSCLGRRIAQVEMLAALAVVFQRYSVELAVDEWADDAAVAAMTDDERRALYAQAQTKSRAALRTATTLLTLKLHGTTSVNVRLIPRGQERFIGSIE